MARDTIVDRNSRFNAKCTMYDYKICNYRRFVWFALMDCPTFSGITHGDRSCLSLRVSQPPNAICHGQIGRGTFSSRSAPRWSSKTCFRGEHNAQDDFPWDTRRSWIQTRTERGGPARNPRDFSTRLSTVAPILLFFFRPLVYGQSSWHNPPRGASKSLERRHRIRRGQNPASTINGHFDNYRTRRIVGR